VRFLARYDVWANPFARPLMDAMRHVRVDRVAPAAAYLRDRALLREGEAVGIFPEAGVSTSTP
jgi:1-acyl-sn-glycerol-3-phosphate acyltransferase